MDRMGIHNLSVEHIYLVLTIVLLTTIQCANRIGLEGGLIDTTPPNLNTDDSDPNFVTNFNDDKFELVFDEFVRINKPGEQIIISPPLQYNLIPIVRGKKIVFEFNSEEELLENTTYTIQFGESIQDITESNPISNLRYVFSTGNIIDSMEVLVQVRDLIDGRPVPDALVMLYETLSDTVIRTGRPIYFSKTDSSGIARVENCRPGEFRVFSLVDENKNYQFDQPEERVGHIDTFIQSSIDPEKAVSIFLYQELIPPVLLDIRRIDSLIFALTIDGDINYVELESLNNSPLRQFIDEDTLFVQTTNYQDSLVFKSDYADADTIFLAPIRQARKKNNRFGQLKVERETSFLNGKFMDFHIYWDNPILEIDADQVRILSSDSIWIKPKDLTVEIDEDERKLMLTWKQDDERDSVLLLPGLVTSWISINDTILTELRPRRPEFLSNLIADVQGLDTTAQYILQLLSSKDELIDEILVSERSTYEWTIEQLDPSKYRLDIITDFNKNGQKDLGWFDFRQFPEPVNSLEIDNLRADWDVQVSIRPSD